ncbi:AIG2-like protein D [Linum perenne]
MMGSSAAPASATAVMDGHKVFVYGSLMADEVVRVLLNRVPHSSAALLNSYHRFSIKGRVYPAILPVDNKKVKGRVLFGITDPELLVLDIFEDVEYQRRTVEVSLCEWKKAHMSDFVKMTAEFMEEVQQPDSKTRVATYESFYNTADGTSSAP